MVSQERVREVERDTEIEKDRQRRARQPMAGGEKEGKRHRE